MFKQKDEFNQKVQKRIEGYADTIGHKAANLKELNDLSQALSDQLQFKIQVPNILPLTHEAILKHLTQHAPEWQALWEAFKDKQQHDSKGLNKEASLKLDELRALILETFRKHPLSEETLGSYLEQIKKTDVMVMVRSTGAEDSIKVANPGAHESAPAQPNAEAISEAIGIVVASYFSDKALQQRFLTQENAVNDIAEILKDPFMPVLIQRMIGEPLMGHKDPNLVVKSGVMYTSDSGARIQLAPGHGELVVNSQAPFDTFFVTREDVVHAEINRKPIRLVPSESKEENTKKTILIRQNNPKELRDEPAISNTVALKIAKAGRIIEKHYGMPMDVEFVYEPNPQDPDNGTLFLVQARPIPKGDLKRVVPSSIPPEQLKEIKENKIPILKGSVITPAGSAARVITNNNQLLICDTITDALKIYLNQKPSPIKAVIVRNEAPETSHEAAVFNSKAIPVLHISDTSDIEDWIDPKIQKKPVLLIDPQRSQCVDFSAVPNIGSAENPEKALFDAGILKLGLFKSPLPARETLVPLFPKVSKKVKEKVIRPKLVAPVSKTRATIGKLIERANSINKKESEHALKKLMPLLFKELPASYVRLDPQQGPQKFYTTLLNNIETLEAAKCGDENADSLKALQELLGAFYQLGKSTEGKKANSPHGKLFRQAMVTGAEIHHALTRLSGADAGTPAGPAAQTEFLNLVSKLEALIVNPGNKNLFSDSLIQIAQQTAALEEAQKVKGFDRLTEEQKTYFVEFVKFKKMALNEAVAAEWIKFSYRCCQNKDTMQLLIQCTKFSRKNNIESDWLNISFENHLKAVRARAPKVLADKVPETVLLSLSKELSITSKELEDIRFDEKRAILDSWECQVGEWADPKKFDDLWKKFEKEFLPLIDQLSIDASQQLLTQKAIIKAVQDLTEILDRTIKAMRGSQDYDEEKEKQVEHFAQLLTPYHHLMEKWVKQLPTDGRDDNVGYYNTKESMLNLMQETFEKLKIERDPKHLNLSGNLSIASARIDSAASFIRQFWGVGKKGSDFLTLEDLFSLFHQNILTRTVFLGQNNQLENEKLPEVIQPLVKAISNIQIERKIEQLSIEHVYPIVQLEFNLPLKAHSAKFFVKYNQETRKTILDVHFFGHNGDNRMDLICVLARLESRILNIRSKQSPNYDAQQFDLNFSLELDSDNISKLTPVLTEALVSYGNLTMLRNTSDTLFSYLSTRHSDNEIKKVLKELSLEETDDILKKFPNCFIDFMKSSTEDKSFAEKIYDLQNPTVLVVEKLITLFAFKADLVRKGKDGTSLIEKLILSKAHSSKELFEFIINNNSIYLLKDAACTQAVLKRKDLQLFIDLSQQGANFNLQNEETKRELIRTIGRAYRRNDVSPIKALIAMDPDIVRDVLLNYLKPEQTKNFEEFKNYLENSGDPVFVNFAKTLEPQPQALIFSGKNIEKEKRSPKPRDKGPSLNL